MENPLYEQIDTVEQHIWSSNNREAILEWDNYSDDLLFQNNAETWDKLSDTDLIDVIRIGKGTIIKYSL
jgi:hypothetical protein